MILHLKPLGKEENLIKELIMDDPTFGDLEAHTASVIFQNPKPQTVVYEAELYLGKTIGDKKATSGVQNFSIPANSQLQVAFNLQTPAITTSQETYKVILPVSVAGNLIVTYVSTEDVVVIFKPAINIIGITWT